MITTYSGKPGEGMSLKTLRKIIDLNKAELQTICHLSSPDMRLIESRFRATDRNLTIRIRSHERIRP